MSIRGIYDQRHMPEVKTGILRCAPMPDKGGDWACAARVNVKGFGYAQGKSEHEAMVKAYAQAIRHARIL